MFCLETTETPKVGLSRLFQVIHIHINLGYSLHRHIAQQRNKNALCKTL